ncbi:mediator of RNA polymerase II transcription subunit 15-like isoform X2 [Mizuhopecten yessoensis]|uniref:mediator of RNA polymerase II transcription subunit 15-like isoform X2 n=1 Tax=Mizuhopecten yessoensis TaxID=6573 RepID=UPI000B4596BB|nr:mediator of RNA polymerase II transcription subunit 15-like isoform X2 [Mizuhopecten yessoensis]
MAEAADHKRGRDTMPRQGKVENVCKQWLVHEDGALAYEIQNKEIERHYGINRFNRRTVRDDIPVAKVLQTDEEVRQQEERYSELQALRVQADEDQEIARRVMEEIEGEETARQRQRELHDEEIARIAQEKEKQKYERYLEKKRGKDLKKERHILEKQLEQHMVEARLASGEEGLDDAMQGMHVSTAGERGSFSGRQVNGGRKLTPGGFIEDDGDFSDFFAVPDHVDDSQKKVIQEMQDEELARLLQEQEHKRTKAEVDRSKLKEIEEQDERLAKIIQEQDKLRMKRAKQRKKQQQQEEHRRQQQMTNSSPAARPLPDLPGQRLSSSDSPMPPVQRPAERTRLRRDSFLQGIDSSQIPPPSVSGDTLQSRQSGRLSRPIDLPQDSVQNVERWLAGTTTAADPADVHHHMLPSPSPPGSYHSEEEMPPYRPPQPPKHVSVINTASPPNPAHRGRNQTEEEPCYAVSNTMYNIAAAIDPTYKRRQHQIHEETDVKIPIQLASSLPTSGEGSLQRDDSFTDEGPVLNPWQPVQGQRRSASDRNKRPKKSVASTSATAATTKGQKNNSSCKQQ